MIKKSIISLLAGLFVLSFFSCDQNPLLPEENVGTVKGKVTLDDSNTQSYGFTVSIPGTSYTAISAKNGSYTIKEVPSDTYEGLIIQKGNFTYYWDTTYTVVKGDSITLDTKNFTTEEITAKDGKDGTDGTSINWLGSFDSADKIENPKKLDVYYNTSDGCSYIYDGEKWELLSKNGEHGECIYNEDDFKAKWLGFFADSSLIEEFHGLAMYYNYVDNNMYFSTTNGWTSITLNSSSNSVLHWLGQFESENQISNPQHYDVYFNTMCKLVFVYKNNEWIVHKDSANKGVSVEIVWDENSQMYYGMPGTNLNISYPPSNKTGYDSGFWSEIVPEVFPSENKIFTYTYVPNVYKINYFDSEGNNIEDLLPENAPKTHTYGSKTELIDLESSEEYKFLGWYDTSDCSKLNINVLGETDVLEDINLFALREEYLIFDNVRDLETLFPLYADKFSYKNDKTPWIKIKYFDREILSPIMLRGKVFDPSEKFKLRFDFSDVDNIQIQSIWDLIPRVDYVTAIRLPYHIKEITGWEICDLCPKLEEITFNGNIEYISGSAFGNLPNLKFKTINDCNYTVSSDKCMLLKGNTLVSYPSAKGDVVLPDYIEAVAFGAFYRNTDITSITFTENIFDIEDGFCGCYNLTSFKNVSIYNVSEDGKKIFYGKNNHCLLAYPSAEGDIELPDYIEFIDNAFSYNEKITSIKGKCAGGSLYGCKNLQKVDFSNATALIFNNDYIGSYFFGDCSRLSDVLLPSNLEVIGIEAFLNCSSLVSINLPESLKIIGNEAFKDSGIEKIKIPSNVIKIGKNAFESTPVYNSLEIYFDDPYNWFITDDYLIYTNVREFSCPRFNSTLIDSETGKVCSNSGLTNYYWIHKKK